MTSNSNFAQVLSDLRSPVTFEMVLEVGKVICAQSLTPKSKQLGRHSLLGPKQNCLKAALSCPIASHWSPIREGKSSVVIEQPPSPSERPPLFDFSFLPQPCVASSKPRSQPDDL
ncbi:alpha-2-macroglobulin-like protein 1 [Striga asiatica]|uniref:Alpha-2-macroglobulin-like protein 1 n=1 Tax=Striga asiatica TaxID=4170 RepID=A0A5A7P490_STRAF|nr:alpha-2-macroglobulin-like protein 1 [Striga asiatica]